MLLGGICAETLNAFHNRAWQAPRDAGWAMKGRPLITVLRGTCRRQEPCFAPPDTSCTGAGEQGGHGVTRELLPVPGRGTSPPTPTSLCHPAVLGSDAPAALKPGALARRRLRVTVPTTKDPPSQKAAALSQRWGGSIEKTLTGERILEVSG